MAGTVIIPWYSTGFRGADLETALNEVAATALRYGASSYAVYRARDDRYKFRSRRLRGETQLGAELGRAGDDRLPRNPLQLVSGPRALRLVGSDHGRRARHTGRDQRNIGNGALPTLTSRARAPNPAPAGPS